MLVSFWSLEPVNGRNCISVILDQTKAASNCRTVGFTDKTSIEYQKETMVGYSYDDVTLPVLVIY